MLRLFLERQPDRAIEEGYIQREIADSAYEAARRKASGERCVVGVNKFVDPSEPAPLEIYRVDPDVESRQIAGVREVRRQRDNARVGALLDRLAQEASDRSLNLVPVTIELVKARATLGEIVTRLRRVCGSYAERPVF
ncbi:MAG: methylmalonyl-CoA mutase family protein [Candidatus Methylomirabilia bacterium]